MIHPFLKTKSMKKLFCISLLLFSFTLNAQQNISLKQINVDVATKQVFINNIELGLLHYDSITKIIGLPNRIALDTLIFRTFYDEKDGFKDGSDLIINKNYIYDSLGIVLRTKKFSPGNNNNLNVDIFIFYEYDAVWDVLNFYPFGAPQNMFTKDFLICNHKIDLESAFINANIKLPLNMEVRDKEVILSNVKFIMDIGNLYSVNYWGKSFSVNIFLNKYDKNNIKYIKISKNN